MVELQNISFLVAFAGGLLSVISPCILPILPTFFAYNFKEKQEIARMTLSFFLGFTLIFILMGFTASYIGQTLWNYKDGIILFAGIMLLFFAVMAFLGKGFSLIRVNIKTGNDASGVFLLGMLFAVGWTPCTGPILSGILLIATTLSTLNAALLLVVYSLGIFIPLFLISFTFDRYKISKLTWLRGKELEFKILNRVLKVHSANLISSLLLLATGLVFVFYRGTAVINNLDPLGTRELFFRLQDGLIGG